MISLRMYLFRVLFYELFAFVIIIVNMMALIINVVLLEDLLGQLFGTFNGGQELIVWFV